MKRSATAVWNGSGKEGTGALTTQSTVLNNSQYSFKTRFEDGIGTNPEELMAAAHAGCFSMKLSFVLGNSGIVPSKIETNCTITMENGVIENSHIDCTVTAEGLTAEALEVATKDAKENCPVSKAYNMSITMDARLG